jgi:Adenovirus IVa2 protein
MATAIPFFHPFTGICSGPTGCGKTQLMKKIILNIDTMMLPSPKRIIWYYSEQQLALEEELGHAVEFREGMPELEEFDGTEPVLLIVDDFMAECNAEIGKLFTKGSHHRNLSIWFLMQNFFHRGKEIRSITLNAHYIILFKNPRDTQQIGVLARQMMGRDSRVLEEAYSNATAMPHGYLLIDTKQATLDYQRLRTHILPGEQLAVYTSKKGFKNSVMTIFV